MDSLASHNKLGVILVAKENKIILFTVLVHISQSLDVGIYLSLIILVEHSLDDFMRQRKLKHSKRILNPANISSFSGSNILKTFPKSEAYFLNKNTVSKQRLLYSEFMNQSRTQH